MLAGGFHEGRGMKYSKDEWQRYFGQFPKWIVILILVMLFIRFVITAVFHWLLG
jgi:hypothetical protein